MTANERDLRVAVVFPERGNSVLTTFSWTTKVAKEFHWLAN